jgi:hypothetical protein
LPYPSDPKPIILNVGITGHRAGGLTAPLVRKLKPLVEDVLRQLRDAALTLQQSEDVFCSDTKARLLLHTGLASGSDQIAASSARSSGYSIRAVLPFEPDEYRKDFAPGKELKSFEKALAATDEIVALPGKRANLNAAYVQVGQSLVSDADVLIAIWDGEKGRGPGGTAHVVEMALENSVPVLHIEVNRNSGKIRMRALMDGDAPAPTSTALRDPDLYTRVLRGAFRLRAQGAEEQAQD